MAKKPIEEKGEIFATPLERVLPDSMLPYAEFVILDRALPRVEDGLKPVQRRILYTMNEMGLTPDKPHKKCARIVGDCMGKYHPHGDSSVYDAMVRMAQDFNMRMTLVDGHGNFGSVDGDPAAAMRYTEARMAPLALELLRDLDKDTVPFSLNFDDSLKEPDILPGRFPNLLVNGASGIAVGLATNIPTHNLGEAIDAVIAYIDNPKITLENMMKIIPGPDFPTGGYILKNELEQAYRTGKGKIYLRAKYAIEEGTGEKRNIVITELPYQVNKSNLLRKIAELCDERKEELGDIASVTDESDRNGMRAVISLKKEADEEKIMKYLFKYTDLQVTFGINMVAIAKGKPQQLGLLDILKYYAEHQREVVLRRSRFDLNNAKARCHILEGLIVAVNNIDEVIYIIRHADNVADARTKLKNRFSLTDRQAQAILDLRLARLTKLEILSLENELKELKEQIKKLTAIIGSQKLQMEVVKEELREVKKNYKSDRRSVIIGSEEEIRIERFDDVKPVVQKVLAMTADHKLKCVTKKNFNLSNKELGRRSTLDNVLVTLLEANSDQKIFAFTNKWNCHKLSFDDLPETKLSDEGIDYDEIVSAAEEGEYPVAFFAIGETFPEGELLFLSKAGMIKRTVWSEYNLAKNVFQAAKLKEGDEIVSVVPYEAEGCSIFFVTRKGMCLNAEMTDIPLQGRISGGVKGMALAEGDEIVFVKQISEEGEIVLATSENAFKRIIPSVNEPSTRYRKGVRVSPLGDDEEIVFASYVREPYMLAVENKDGSLVELSTEDIAIRKLSQRPVVLRDRDDIHVKAIYPMEYRSID
ncbi:MAG: DNA topoisomerase 4 subunit A [Clostridia bacterium]|nr:DNA topoisomerase 4 subunit A [Clostridia bacterium]